MNHDTEPADRQLLVGMRLAPVNDEALEDRHTWPLRTGQGLTVVAEPNDDFEHVAGPVYWRQPPSERGRAECAACGASSKPYRPADIRHARRWAHHHRCTPAGG